MTAMALDDVKVVDLTHHISGPYCTKLLADYGAEVIKVERPDGGDPTRRKGPFPGDVPHPEKSGLFLHLNTNKKSITLNLKSERGKLILRELIKDADILVENFAPRVLPSLGLSYEELERINPRLVMVSISNFGQTGPYRDFKSSELVTYAMGGTMWHTGLSDREPIKLGLTVIQFQAGLVASTATMGAFFGSRYQGIGQHVDVGMMEVQTASHDRGGQNLVALAFSGTPSMHRLTIGRTRTIMPNGVYPCADGYLQFTMSRPSWWNRLCRVLERPDLMDSPRYTGENLYNLDLKDEVDAIVLEWLGERTKKEVQAKAQAEQIAVIPINNLEDVFWDPHMRERGFFVEIDHPEAGAFEYPGAPFKFMKTPWRAGRAPLLGEHNEEILTERLGYTKLELVQLRQSGVI